MKSLTKKPLRIPEVLKVILGYLSLADLKSCRFVNTFWRDVATNPMRKKSSIVCIRYDIKENVANSENLLECIIGAGTHFPCSKFDLQMTFPTLVEGIGVERYYRMITTFLEISNAWITEFKMTVICCDIWESGSGIAQLAENVEFPSLKIFKISVFGNPSQNLESLQNFIPLVRHILGKATRLEKLEVSHGSDAVFDSVLVKEMFMMALTEKSSFTSFRSNDWLTITNKEWTTLTTAGVKLKSMTGSFFVSEGGTGIAQFLRSQDDTLEVLDMRLRFWERGRDKASPIPIIKFPCMKCLVDLRLESSGSSNTIYDTFDHETFPVLKRLCVGNGALHGKYQAGEVLNFGVKAIKALEELTMPFDYNAWKARNLMSRMANFCPNIKKLEIPAKSEVLNVVYEKLPNLEELILHTANFGPNNVNDCIDYIITGLREDEIRNARKQLEGWSEKFKGSDMIFGKNSMIRLEKMKILRIFKSHQFQGPNKRALDVTKVSICLVFLEMKSLQCVDFGERKVSPDSVIHSPVMEALKKKCTVLWRMISM